MSPTASPSSRHRQLGLTDYEYELIVEKLEREPNDVELRDAVADVVRALRVQALAQAAADASDRGPARTARPRRERGRGRRRRRARDRVQGRVAQPPERGRAVPGRGDRGRRDPARRVRGRRAADRRARFAAVRRARGLGAFALPARPRGRGDRPLRQLDRGADRRRRDLLRTELRAELPDQRDVPRDRAPRAADAQRRGRPGQRARAARRADRPRRDRRRVRARERRARRGRRGQAPVGPDRRPVRREEAARVLPRAARPRAAGVAPGPRRRRPDLVVVGDGEQGRRRARHRRLPRAAARAGDGAVRDHGLRVAGADAVRGRARAGRRGGRGLRAVGGARQRRSAR